MTAPCRRTPSAVSLTVTASARCSCSPVATISPSAGKAHPAPWPRLHPPARDGSAATPARCCSPSPAPSSPPSPDTPSASFPNRSLLAKAKHPRFSSHTARLPWRERCNDVRRASPPVRKPSPSSRAGSALLTGKAVVQLACHPEQAFVAQRELVLSEVEGDPGAPIRAGASRAQSRERRASLMRTPPLPREICPCVHRRRFSNLAGCGKTLVLGGAALQRCVPGLYFHCGL